MRARRWIVTVLISLTLTAIVALVSAAVMNDNYVYSHSVPVMLAKAYKEVPLGTRKSQVVLWAKANHFQIASEGTKLLVLVDDQSQFGVCSNETTDIYFSFDERQKVTRREGQFFGDCL